MSIKLKKTCNTFSLDISFGEQTKIWPAKPIQESYLLSVRVNLALFCLIVIIFWRPDAPLLYLKHCVFLKHYFTYTTRATEAQHEQTMRRCVGNAMALADSLYASSEPLRTAFTPGRHSGQAAVHMQVKSGRSYVTRSIVSYT